MPATLIDELECARLAVAWSFHIDRHANDAVIALFAEDGILHGQAGFDGVGREAILKMLQKRSPNRVTRHVLAAPFIEMTGADEARGVAAFTVYDGFRDQHEGDGPMPLLPAVTVGEFHQTYRRTADGWRIATCRSVPVFKKP
ncbi:MAG: hypothetical protein DI569_00155 [Sphingopyxis macrogoltabida]|uniref:SnoaL-like domain-containing protein n=1 Tax=Sphingopyxis macrogoltabida TaxID=33050 RepID=A0A2W5NE77_SPHMC|nr:MAG: hypothetical protein DI569_00155 [Sphingopyxis macrogoltabida]